jgi:uncharacterized protein (DUF362 family)
MPSDVPSFLRHFLKDALLWWQCFTAHRITNNKEYSTCWIGTTSPSNWSDPHFRRSYVARTVSQQVNKFINLPVLKHHQSAGVTIALKNMSHGMVNNVNRSHLTPTGNACGIFIPSVVSLPVIREKAVLHICDAVKAS